MCVLRAQSLQHSPMITLVDSHWSPLGVYQALVVFFSEHLLNTTPPLHIH